MKPVGLPLPNSDKEAYAVVQLRRENREGSMYNLVGFQTHLTFGEQRRVFRMIPGLADAVFFRYGVIAIERACALANVAEGVGVDRNAHIVIAIHRNI